MMDMSHGVEMEHKRMKKLWAAHPEWHVTLERAKTLFPWQETGVAFLHNCREKFGFCLLSDEMGIGKVTIPLNSLD
jgi:SNF2 family DNA or RNA helicase